MSEEPASEGRMIRLASRTSRLALCQVDLVEDILYDEVGDVETDLVEIKTAGDRRRDWSLEKDGGTGLFTREVEEALLDGRADLAIHSAKDMPSEDREGLEILGYVPRGNPHDVLVSANEEPEVFATSSPRRRLQGQRLFPAAQWKEIRGNVETRLEKIAKGEADATFLAHAALQRLEIEEWPGLLFCELSLAEMVPAAGQGAIAIQCRKGEYEDLRPYFCEQTAYALKLERSILAALGVGCQVAFGLHWIDGELHYYHSGLEESATIEFQPEEEAIAEACQKLVEEGELGVRKGDLSGSAPA